MSFPRRCAGAVLAVGLGTALLGAPAVAVPVSAAAPAVAPATRPAILEGWQEHMLRKVNELRAAEGIAPLRLCPALADSAQDYAAQLASTNTFDHVAPDGSTVLDRVVGHGYRASIAGENLGGGQRTVVEVVRAWRASPSHLAAMKNPRFRHVGFGYANVSGTTYGSYWVQHFAAGGSCTGL